jgi:hypothetical protein
LALTLGPTKVPLTPFEAGAGLAATAVDALLEAVAVGFFVAVVFVATGVAELVVVATATGDEAAIAGPPRAKGSVDENCDGVIAMTAPRPPKVPPAINNARFIRFSLKVLVIFALEVYKSRQTLEFA